MTNYKKFVFRISSICLIAISLFLTSCEKDKTLSPKAPDTPNTAISSPDIDRSFARLQQDSSDVDQDGNDDELCFDIVFPITVIFPDGSTEIVDDFDNLIIALDRWYDANQDSDEDPTLKFPLDVLIDGEKEVVNSEEELCELWDDCYDEEEEEEYEEYEEDLGLCFDFVFPIELVYPDGSKETVDSEEALLNSIENWYDANPDVDGDISLTFPIQVVYGDSTVQIDDMNAFEDLVDACDEFDEHAVFQQCFTFNYPIDLLFPDSTTTTVDNDAALITTLDNWYDANEDSDEDVYPVFPLDITMVDDGSIVTVNNVDEFEEIIDICYDELCPDEEGRVIMRAPGTAVNRAAISIQSGL